MIVARLRIIRPFQVVFMSSCLFCLLVKPKSIVLQHGRERIGDSGTEG